MQVEIEQEDVNFIKNSLRTRTARTYAITEQRVSRKVIRECPSELSIAV